MASKRLSDTAAISSAMPVKSPSMNESVSVDVRQIDNGYVVRESRCGPTGYSCSEKFSPEKPRIGEMTSRPSIVGSETLGDAVGTLKKRN